MTDNPDQLPGMLQGVRVLEVTEPLGALVGRFLADLGADVIKIEPPEGDGGATPPRLSIRVTNASACPLCGPT